MQADTIWTNARVLTGVPQAGLIERGVVAQAGGRIVYAGPIAGAPHFAAMATVDEQPTGQTPVSVEAMLEKFRNANRDSAPAGYTLHFQPGAATPAPGDMQSLLQQAGDKSVGRIVAAGSNGLDGLDGARLALSRARAVAAGLGQPAVPAAIVFDPALPPDTVVVEWSPGGTPSG